MSEWHRKVWGSELWLVNNELYCAKYLYLSPGYRCSSHRHSRKDETFTVLAGRCVLEFGDEQRIMESGDSQRIAPGTWHRFSNEDAHTTCVMHEASTSHDDADVERRDPSGPLS